MLFTVRHETRYRYDAPVALGPHTLRLEPRVDGAQRLLAFDLMIDPQPAGQTRCLDRDGNVVTRAWFAGPTTHLTIVSSFRVETVRTNPFDFLLDPDDMRLPPPPAQVRAALAPPVLALADRLAADTRGETLAFLDRLTRHLYDTIRRDIREDGPPQTPEETLARGVGACRDQTVLFNAICQARGLAARFVSGYQSHSSRPRRYLHAWAEVYLHGAGWRGYDPTRGLAVADGHVPLAAAPEPAGAMPVEGGFRGAARGTLDFDLAIEAT